MHVLLKNSSKAKSKIFGTFSEIMWVNSHYYSYSFWITADFIRSLFPSRYSSCFKLAVYEQNSFEQQLVSDQELFFSY